MHPRECRGAPGCPGTPGSCWEERLTLGGPELPGPQVPGFLFANE